jgi:hypothetical protein
MDWNWKTIPFGSTPFSISQSDVTLLKKLTEQLPVLQRALKALGARKATADEECDDGMGN